MKKPDIASTPFDYSKMKGIPGHCFAAQIWDKKGNSVAVIESRLRQKKATNTAAAITLAMNETFDKNVNPAAIEPMIDFIESIYRNVPAIQLQEAIGAEYYAKMCKVMKSIYFKK